MLLLVACAPADAPAPAEARYEPVPYVVDEPDPPVPALTAEAIEAAIGEAVAGVLAVHAGPVLAAYVEAMAGSDGCPDYDDYDGSRYWYDECTSAAGTAYSGYAFWVAYDAWADGYGNVYDGHALYGVGDIALADGTRFEFGGSAYEIVATPAGVDPLDPAWHVYYQSVVQGAFAYDGPAAAGTWLAEGGEPDLNATVYYAPAYDGKVVALAGSAAATADGVATAVVLDDVVLMSDNLVPDCPGEPSGVVSVRDADGQWYDVLFDGPAEYGAATDPDLCDGCGSAWFRGELLGTVCPDFSPLLGWEGRPW
jgi:hypothetical protein